MPRIKYVGLKDGGESAFADESGIARWMPGDTRDVSPDVARRMLKHPDVFAPADTGTATPGAALSSVAPAPAAPVPAPASTPTIAPGAEIPAADPIAGLDDAGVRAFANEQGLKINGIALFKGANLRTKVTDALKAKK